MYVSLLKLRTIVSNVTKLRSTQPTLLYSMNGYCTRSISQKLQKDDDLDNELNKPTKYSSSPAYTWQAKHTRLGSAKEPRLWYEPYVILTSITIFMIYFAILREENEVDNTLRMSLYDRIEGLEELQLRTVYQYNLENGLETEPVVKRLKEIEAAKQKVN